MNIRSIIIFALSLVIIGAGCSETSLNTASNITTGTPKKINISPSSKETANSNILDLSKRNLNKVPTEIFDNQNITELNLSNNNLTGALPAEIRKLKNLRILNIRNNRMTGLPAELGQLTNLESLDASNNELTGLPYELGNLKKLKIFNLKGNNFSTEDLERIKTNLPSSTGIITK